MKIFSRYVLKEMVSPFFLGFLVFTFILLFGQIYQLIDLIINKGIGFFITCRLFLLYLPTLMAMTVPLAFLLACLLAFDRLSSDNELIAARASGVGLRRLFLPPIWAGLLLSLALLGFGDTVLPQASLAYKKLLYEIVGQHATVLIQEKTFITGFPGYIFYIKNKDEKTGLLQDIEIFDLGKDQNPLSTIFAKQGKLVKDNNSYKVTLELQDGVIHQLGKQSASYYNQLFFNTYDLNLDVSQVLGDSTTQRSPREMSLAQLSQNIQQQKQAGKDVNSLLCEYHLKLAVPFACLAFSLIGSPLGCMSKRSSRFIGGAISLGLMFIYYILLFTGQLMGTRGMLNPLISIWYPNLLFAILGVFFLIYTSREKPLLKL